MLAVAWSVCLFIIAIVLLVTIHEYGHFIVARACGVKVLRFSIGFGKPFYTYRTRSGMAFVLAIIPLGGYVKMLDEREAPVAAADLPYAFNRKHPLQRIAVVLAGPLFNILFAIVAYWLIFIIGVTQVIPVIGGVVPDSIAANAGLAAGHEIVMIDDEATPTWESVRLALLTQLGSTATLAMTTRDLDAQTTRQHQLTLASWQVNDDAMNLLDSLGIEPFIPEIPNEIASVLENTPAAAAGLQAGDKIIAIDGQPFTDWRDIVDYIAARPEQDVALAVERQGSPLTLTVGLKTQDVGGEAHGFLGVQSVLPSWPAALQRTVRYNVLSAWGPALEKTWDLSLLSVHLLWKMLSGDISWENMSGPIGIAQGASYSASQGLTSFIHFLALISISLAIINLLPIPILDGGHFVYYLFELITKKPVPEKVQAFAAQVGIFLLLAVMILAFYNDINRW